MRLLIFTIFLFSVNLLYSNEVREYKVTKRNITIITYGGFDSIKVYSILERFLDKTLEKTINRNDLKVLVVIGEHAIWNYDRRFISLSYDILRTADLEFIDDYYQYRDSTIRFMNYKKNKILIDLPEPIDINSSYDTTSTEFGLKVIYNGSIKDSVFRYDQLFSVIDFGIRNIDIIKTHQRRITVTFWNEQKHISLVTYDTAIVNSIPIIDLDFDPDEIDSSKEKNNLYYLLGFLLVLLLSVFIYRRKFLLKQKNG